MIIPQKYFAVNWADGMKVNKEHFIASENFTIDSLRDVASLSLNHFNYGILPPLNESEGQQLRYEISKSGSNQLKINVLQCEAVTPGGMRISITGEGLIFYTATRRGGEEAASDSLSAQDSNEYYYLILGVNLFSKVAFGQPDAEEVPIRQPFMLPSYTMQLVPADFNVGQLGGYHLVIGRIVVKGDDYSKDNDFIPPCTVVSSSERLMRDRQTIITMMAELQKCAKSIANKINIQTQVSEVSVNLKTLTLIILNFTGEHYFYFRNMTQGEPPVYLINAISSLAGLMHNHLEILTEKDRTDLLGYFAGWSDSTPKALTDRLERVIEIDYRHHQVGDCMKIIHQMLLQWTNLWHELARLNYHPQYNPNQNQNIIVATDKNADSAAKRDTGNIIIQ